MASPFTPPSIPGGDPSTTLHNLIPLVYAGTNSAGANPGNSTATFSPFIVQFPMTLNRITIAISVSSGNLDVGIYDSDGTNNAPGTRLVSLGTTASPGTGVKTFTLTDTLLVSGLYYAAFVGDNGTIAINYSNAPSPLLGALSRYDKASSFPLPAAIASPTAVLNTLASIIPSAAT